MPNYPQSPSIRKLFQKGQPISTAKGEIIIGNEPVPAAVYYISTGYVKIYSISDDGDQYLHIIYGPGELFPLVWAYLDIGPDELLYETISPCSLWRISRETFGTLIKTDLELSYALSVQLAQQFRLYTDRIDNLEYKKAGQRVAYRLLYLASRFGTRSDDTVTIEAPITHEIFANSINLARESVSREIEKLEKQDIIKRSGHRLQITDMRQLEAKLSRPVSFDTWNMP